MDVESQLRNRHLLTMSNPPSPPSTAGSGGAADYNEKIKKRNREAAQRSRTKKKNETEYMQRKIEELERTLEQRENELKQVNEEKRRLEGAVINHIVNCKNNDGKTIETCRQDFPMISEDRISHLMIYGSNEEYVDVEMPPEPKRQKLADSLPAIEYMPCIYT